MFRLNRPKSNPEAANAVRDATKNLEKVKARHPEVREVSQTLKSLRERNHFAEQLEALMGGAQ